MNTITKAMKVEQEYYDAAWDGAGLGYSNGDGYGNGCGCG